MRLMLGDKVWLQFFLKVFDGIRDDVHHYVEAGKGQTQTVKVGRTLMSKILLYSAAVRFILFGIEGPTKAGKTAPDQTWGIRQ